MKTQLAQQEYKETELGLLPESWEVARLENVSKLIMGQSPPGETYNENGTGMPFLQGKAEFNTVYPKHIKYTTKPLKIAPKDSVLISVRAPVGDVNIANIDYCIGRGLASISLSNKENRFLFYLLTYFKPEIEKEGTGSTFKAINKTKLLEFKIPYPPLPEQQKIAHVLSTIQTAQEKTEAVITALKELKKSMMKHLFTYGPVSLEEAKNVKLKETEIGQIPEGWKEYRVKDYCQILTGGTPKTEIKEYYEPPEIPWMKSGEIQGYKISKLDTYISKNGLENSNARILPKNSVVIALAGRGKTRGTTSLLAIECACNQSVVCMVPNEQLLTPFLHYYLSNLYAYIRNLTGDKDRSGLNKEIIGNIHLFLPSFSIQQQIASILSSVDDKIKTEETKKKSLEELFKSMLYNLMAAKIRVNQLVISNEKTER